MENPSHPKNPYILIVYYSRSGHTKQLAHAIANGVESSNHHKAVVRCLPPVRPSWTQPGDSIPESGPLYAQPADLIAADGIVLGSPTRFGNLAAPMQYFLEQLGGLWHDNALVNKPAGAFCSTSSLHGGQETTLQHMLTPLMHLGMLPVGVSYETKALSQTLTGGTPYGPSHYTGPDGLNEISKDEKEIAHAFGQRMSLIAKQLQPVFQNAARVRTYNI